MISVIVERLKDNRRLYDDVNDDDNWPRAR